MKTDTPLNWKECVQIVVGLAIAITALVELAWLIVLVVIRVLQFCTTPAPAAPQQMDPSPPPAMTGFSQEYLASIHKSDLDLWTPSEQSGEATISNEIVAFSNASDYGGEPRTISRHKYLNGVVDPQWHEAFGRWIKGQNPSDQPEWKQGVIAHSGPCALTYLPILDQKVLGLFATYAGALGASPGTIIKVCKSQFLTEVMFTHGLCYSRQ